MTKTASTSAFKIFLKYVEEHEDGSYSAEKVLTAACYQEYIRSRLTKPKNPAEAFRKIINSHITATSGLKPFNPEVEKALLIEVRKQRVWPCFANTKKIRIGLNGFKRKGFWESRTPQDKITTISSKANLNCSVIEQLFDITTTEEFEGILSHYKNKFGDEQLRKSILKFKTIIKGNTRLSKSMRRFLEVYTKHFSKHIVQLLILNMFRQQTMFKIDTTVEWKLNSDQLKYFFSKEFIIPSQEHRNFSCFKPIGKCYGDLALTSAIETDVSCRDLYRGDIVGTSAIDLRVFRSQTFFYQDEMMESFMTTGEAWNRTIEYRFDGSIVVMLNRYYKCPEVSSCGFCEMQDVTEMFYDKLKAIFKS